MNRQVRAYRETRRTPMSAAAGRWIGLVAGLLIAGMVGAQQETLGSILDRGAKKMPNADVRAVLASGIPKAIRPYPEAEDFSLKPDGTMSGYFAAYNVWAVGAWAVDDEGRLCFDGFSGWTSAVCYHWFKLGETIYMLESPTEPDRDQKVSILK